ATRGRAWSFSGPRRSGDMRGFVPRPSLTIPRPELRINWSRANGLVEKGPAGMRFRVFETGSRRSFGLLLGSALMVSLLVTMAVNRGAIADDWGSETPGTVAVPALTLTPAGARLKADVSFLAADAREG